MRLVVIWILIFSLLLGGYGVAFADSVDEVNPSNYTNVLDDLAKDENFNSANYPTVVASGKLEVIQLAESVNGEVFLYVYQPGRDFVTASSVNISQAINDSLKFVTYKLQLLNRVETLAKYIVLGIEVKPDIQRYYSVSSISRPAIDSEAVPGQTVNEISLPVGKLFTATTVNGEVFYSESHEEVVEILNPFHTHLEYMDGVGWEILINMHYYRTTDVFSHIIAFSTNREIERLYEVEMEFDVRNWTANRWLYGQVKEGKTYVGESEHKTVTISHTQSISVGQNGKFMLQFGFDRLRIQSVKDFLDTEPSLSRNEVEINSVKNSQWIVRFYESDVLYENVAFGGIYTKVSGQDVSNVTVLRLKFLENGNVYNLGAVSNTVTGDDVPLNEGLSWTSFLRKWDNFWNSVGNFFEQYWWVIAIVVVLIALAVLSAIFPPVWKVVKMIFKVLWWVISAPARLVVLIADKAKSRKDNSG